jgi:flagellar protein FliO/FliZ
MTGSFLQMTAGLVVVLGAIALSAWFARRMGAGSGGSARLMKVVSALPVGAKERVVVVELGGQWMVLGVAPGRVSALATLPKGELPEASPAGAHALPMGIDFAALLKKARRGA